MPELSADQIKQAYGGYAGWNDPAAIVANFRETGGEGKGGPGLTTGAGAASTGGRQSSQDVYQGLSDQYGLGDLKSTATSLREQIYEIEDYLKGVEGDVQERAGGFLMTEAQQRRLMASESEPSRKSLAELSTSYGRTTSNIASITGDINTQMSMIMADQRYQEELRRAAASAGVSITGSMSPEDILTAIAGKVNEQELWDRSIQEQQLAKSGVSAGTATERKSADALSRLQADIQAGSPYYELGPRYMSELPLSQIRAEYNKGPMAKQHGGAAETAATEAQWGVKPKAGGDDEGIKYQLPDGTIITL